MYFLLRPACEAESEHHLFRCTMGAGQFKCQAFHRVVAGPVGFRPKLLTLDSQGNRVRDQGVLKLEETGFLWGGFLLLSLTREKKKQKKKTKKR